MSVRRENWSVGASFRLANMFLSYFALNAHTQDEHYDSRIRSSTTPSAIVYGRIRCKLRSYTVVFRCILDSWITTVSRRVVYDEIRPYTVVYDVVYHRILTSMFLVKRWDLPFSPSRGLQISYIYTNTYYWLYRWSKKNKKKNII